MTPNKSVSIWIAFRPYFTNKFFLSGHEFPMFHLNSNRFLRLLWLMGLEHELLDTFRDEYHVTVPDYPTFLKLHKSIDTAYKLDSRSVAIDFVKDRFDGVPY